MANPSSNLPDTKTLSAVVALYSVMSDMTRMRIILTIATGPITVTELAEKLMLGQSTVSHQLQLLKRERLVIGNREGKQIYYELVDDHVIEIYQLTLNHIKEANNR